MYDFAKNIHKKHFTLYYIDILYMIYMICQVFFKYFLNFFTAIP